MTNLAYSEAAREVLEILEHTEAEAVDKIPLSFINYLKDNSSKTYNPNFDFNEPISKLNLKPKTEAILGLIYLKYWATEEEKLDFKKKLKNNEIKYNKEFMKQSGSSDIFKKNSTHHQESAELIVVEDINFIQKLVKKIQNMFRR